MGKVRDLVKGDPHRKEPIEYLSLTDWERKQRLALFYMRRAAMGPEMDLPVNDAGLIQCRPSALIPIVLGAVLAVVFIVTLALV